MYFIFAYTRNLLLDIDKKYTYLSLIVIELTVYLANDRLSDNNRDCILSNRKIKQFSIAKFPILSLSNFFISTIIIIYRHGS